MFSKVFATISVLLAVSSQVHGHAIIAPPLGVTGTPARSDVQRPSTASPCGTINVASTLDTSTPVQAAADGTFTTTATDFNAGADGSTSVSAKVDPTAQGTTFTTPVTVSANGIAAPTTVGSAQIVAALPAGTTCSGGTAGNLCLVQFTTTAGFGNCVVVAQGASTANATTAATGSANSTTVATGAANSTTGATAAAAKGKAAKAGKKGAKAAAKAAKAAKAGTRAPRALLADLEVRDETVAKRGLLSWVWA